MTTVAAGALWSVPVIESFTSTAAAVSGTATVSLNKSANGSTDPPLATLCQNGAGGNAGRGTAVFVRTEGGTPTICVTMTMSTGATATGRDIFILQSNAGGTCLSGTTTRVGTWSGTLPNGPQTFCTAIVAGATRFVVAQQLSGGGGNDGWSSTPPVSLP